MEQHTGVLYWTQTAFWIILDQTGLSCIYILLYVPTMTTLFNRSPQYSQMTAHFSEHTAHCVRLTVKTKKHGYDAYHGYRRPSRRLQCVSLFPKLSKHCGVLTTWNGLDMAGAAQTSPFHITMESDHICSDHFMQL